MHEPFTRKNFLRLTAGAALAPAAGAALGAVPADATSGPGWGQVGDILRKTQPPHFPPRDFPITRTARSATARPMRPPPSARRSQPATEPVAAGSSCRRATFLTGAIHLKYNVNLHVSEGATLLFSTDPAQYLPVVLTRFEGVECMNYSPLIYAHDCENIAVTGTGTLDGQATWETWWVVGRPVRPDAKALHAMAEEGVPVEDRVYGDGHFLRAALHRDLLLHAMS